MSRENVKKFFELVKTEEQLARKVVEMNDGMHAGKFGDETQVIENQILPIAKEYDLDFTVEEFLAYSQEHAGELSDEMLMAVTGGLMSPRAIAIGLLATTAISFIPSIVGSLASGGGDPVPPAAETSISQTYDQDMDEDTVVDKPSFELEDSGLATPPNSPIITAQEATGTGGSGALNMDEVMLKLDSLKTDMKRADTAVTAPKAQLVQDDVGATGAELRSAPLDKTETAKTEVKAADETAAVVEQKVGDLESVPTEVFGPFDDYLQAKGYDYVEEADLPGVLEAIKPKIKEQADRGYEFSVDMENNTITNTESNKTFDLMNLLKHENIHNFRSHMLTKLDNLQRSYAGTDLEAEYTALKTNVDEVKTLSQAKEVNAKLDAFENKVATAASMRDSAVDTETQITTWSKLPGTPSWTKRVEHVLEGIKNYSNLDESSKTALAREANDIKNQIKGGNQIKSGRKVKYGQDSNEQANLKQIRDFANGR